MSGAEMSENPVASLGESSLLGALMEKLWVNSFLSLVGLQLVPVSKTTEVKALPCKEALVSGLALCDSQLIFSVGPILIFRPLMCSCPPAVKKLKRRKEKMKR